MKKELSLKEKLKKQPKKRKPRGRVKKAGAAAELGNGDVETDENHDAGDNDGRRRPRRAAAPTFSFENPADSESGGATGNGTPGRRGGREASKTDKADSGA